MSRQRNAVEGGECSPVLWIELLWEVLSSLLPSPFSVAALRDRSVRVYVSVINYVYSTVCVCNQLYLSSYVSTRMDHDSCWGRILYV